jgi:hypothetical protein
MKTLEIEKSELPYNTEVIMSGFNNQEIYIIEETEKAFLMCYEKKIKRGMTIDRKEITFWCPKSVWFNDKNFINSGNTHDSSKPVTFKAPFFVIK